MSDCIFIVVEIQYNMLAKSVGQAEIRAAIEIFYIAQYMLCTDVLRMEDLKSGLSDIYEMTKSV